MVNVECSMETPPGSRRAALPFNIQHSTFDIRRADGAVPAGAARLRLFLSARPRFARRIQNRVVVLHRAPGRGWWEALRIRADVLSSRSRAAGPGREDTV